MISLFCSCFSLFTFVVAIAYIAFLSAKDNFNFIHSDFNASTSEVYGHIGETALLTCSHVVFPSSCGGLLRNIITKSKTEPLHVGDGTPWAQDGSPYSDVLLLSWGGRPFRERDGLIPFYVPASPFVFIRCARSTDLLSVLYLLSDGGGCAFVLPASRLSTPEPLGGFPACDRLHRVRRQQLPRPRLPQLQG